MALPTTYPTGTEIAARLLALGITLPATYDKDVLVATAIAEWERLTGRKPFLEDGSAADWAHDPPGADSRLSGNSGGARVLFFDYGFTTITSITIGVTYDTVGVAVDMNRQVRLYPINAPTNGKPYEWCEFVMPVYGPRQSVVVNGKRGYASSANFPADAYQGVMDIACSQYLLDTLAALVGSGSTQTEGDETVTLFTNPKLYEERANAMFQRAMRLAVGFRRAEL